MSGVRPSHDPPNKGVSMSKSEDVLNRAYGNFSKEVTPILSFDITIFRGFKYYWYRLIRKITR